MQAAHLLRVRRPDDAVALLRRLVATDPEDAAAHHLLAAALLEGGQAADAVGAAERTCALAPDAEWAHRVRSQALLAAGRGREAIDAAKQATGCDPAVSGAWITLAIAEADAGSKKRALAAAERARAIDPEDAAVQRTLAYVAIKRRKWLDAEEHAQIALREEPDDPLALNYLGVALMRQGRGDEAVPFFASASRANPRRGAARHNAIAAVGGGLGAIAVVQIGRVASREYSDSPVFLAILAIGGIAVGVTALRGHLRRKRLGIEYPKASREQMRAIQRERNEQLRFRPEEASLITVLVLLVMALAICAGGIAVFIAAQSSPDRLPWTITAIVLGGLGGFLAVQAAIGLARRSRAPR